MGHNATSSSRGDAKKPRRGGGKPNTPRHQRHGQYLARGALGAIQGRPLLGLAEVGVVRVAAPQLLAGVEGAELQSQRDTGGGGAPSTRPTPWRAFSQGRRRLKAPGGCRLGRYQQGRGCTHCRAGFVAHAEIETALLVHGVVDAWQLGEHGPLVLKGVVQKAVVGTVGWGQRSGGFRSFPSPQPSLQTQILQNPNSLSSSAAAKQVCTPAAKSNPMTCSVFRVSCYSAHPPRHTKPLCVFLRPLCSTKKKKIMGSLRAWHGHATGEEEELKVTYWM